MSTPICDDERDRCRECGMEFVPIEVAEVLEERALKAEAALKARQSDSARIMPCDPERQAGYPNAAPQARQDKEGQSEPLPAAAAHVQTDRCGFDRNASHSEDTYVCTCGWSIRV